MATTTNYGWTTPDDTALVKDGAAAIRTLGSSVDTTTKALNPSTTLGDIEYRSSTANTNTRLPIGTTGQVLSVSGGVPAWVTTSSGAVVQVKSATKSDTFSSSGTSYQDITGLSVSITPTSASNKILVIASVQGAADLNVVEANLQLMRDSTAIGIGDAAGSRTRSTVEFGVPGEYSMASNTLTYLDSPATTSATTYKVQIQVRSSTGYINRSVVDTDSSSNARGASTITVMEVTP